MPPSRTGGSSQRSDPGHPHPGHRGRQTRRTGIPSGILVTEDHTQHTAAEERTRKLLADPSVPAIFEAAFTHDNIRVRADILHRISGKKWRLPEVKSTTEVKDYHLPDVAVQKYVIESCGCPLADVCLMHLNRQYVFDGKEYDPSSLFTIESLAKQ